MGELYSDFGNSRETLQSNVAGGLLSASSTETNLNRVLAAWDAVFSFDASPDSTSPPAPAAYGSTFLLFNITTSEPYENTGTGWQIETWHDYNLSNDTTARYTESGPWLNIHTRQPSSCQSHAPGALLSCFPNGTTDLSITLYYTAWDTARLDVNMYADSSRSEPIISWLPAWGLYTDPDLGVQLGFGIPSASIASRSIMALSYQSWIRSSKDYTGLPPLAETLSSVSSGAFNVSDSPNSYLPPDWTILILDDNLFESQSRAIQDVYPSAHALLAPIVEADFTMAALLNQFLNLTRSPAHTLSAMITIMSSMTYYDQMPRYQDFTNSTQVYFTPVLYPQSHRGLWAVLIVMAAHTCLVGAIATAFVLRSRVTLLGNYWHTIAQLYSAQSETLFTTATLDSDTEVRRQLYTAGGRVVYVGVGPEEHAGHNRVALSKQDV
jgi:hypothetical protein